MTLNLCNLFRRTLYHCISLSYKWKLFYFHLIQQQKLICEMTEKLLKWNKSQAEYAYVTLTRYLPVQVSILPDSRLNSECISLLRSQAAISGKGCVDVTLAYLEKKTTIYRFSEITSQCRQRKENSYCKWNQSHTFLADTFLPPRCEKTSS